MKLGALRIERVFVRDLAGVMRGVHDMMMSHLMPAMKEVTKSDSAGIPSGKPSADVDAVMRAVLPQIGPKVGKLHTKMSDGLVRNYNAKMKEILPIGFSKLPSTVQMQAGIARDKSIALVENAARVYAQQVRDIFSDPANTLGVRWEDLQAQLMERGDVSESRAELIARDQTLKLNGAINQSTQQSVGVDSYTWSTSNDERVRDEHAELEGETFDWNSPPEPGHPGEDFQCRCIALPIIDLGKENDE